MTIAQRTNPAARISDLNDALRVTGCGGAMVMTAGVAALTDKERVEVLAAVQGFANFTSDNDPYGEHDCAILAVGKLRIIWKIDYYDLTMAAHSPDPADPAVTRRVLTIMLAEEY